MNAYLHAKDNELPEEITYQKLLGFYQQKKNRNPALDYFGHFCPHLKMFVSIALVLIPSLHFIQQNHKKPMTEFGANVLVLCTDRCTDR